MPAHTTGLRTVIGRDYKHSDPRYFCLENSGDGFKFSGKGFVQLTGRSNYAKFTIFVGEDCIAQPDLVATKYPLASAAFFFDSNGLWLICDKGSDDNTVTLVTKRVNGGTIGLDARLANFKKYFAILGA